MAITTLKKSTATRFEQEKQAYWAMHDKLKKDYFGKWVAIVGSKVVAFGERKTEVLKKAFDLTKSEVGYINRVGYEEMTRQKRIRQIIAGWYDEKYDPPIPMVETAVINSLATIETQVDFIIDTGADLTLIREEIADRLSLWNYVWDEAEISGIGATPQRRRLYLVVVEMAEQKIPITVDCRNDLNENILGRDVINEFEMIVCAKRDVVRFKNVPDTN